MKKCALLLVVLSLSSVKALHAYGHAYGEPRPNDFTQTQFQQIASSFEIFTVEKAHAGAVYGNASAHPPFKTNSIAATIGTARKIKAINASVKVLMYWNSAIFYDFYECEKDVQPDWLVPDPRIPNRKLYNYSVAAFRTWWVKCCLDAMEQSQGAIDGFFLDATPKVARHLDLWGEMVDQLRAKLPKGSLVLDNGFYMGPSGNELAGEAAWAHTGFSYVESLANTLPLKAEIKHLLWLANASRAYPDRILVGHGQITVTPAMRDSITPKMDPIFEYGLAKYLLITNSVEKGWFLANHGYGIADGLLEQPFWVYRDGLGCGEPTAMMKRLKDSSSFERQFEHGTLIVHLDNKTASINC